MRELVVISGKGGAGKTSIVASFAALASGHVMADCDVDAADLHLILSPETRRREDFYGGKKARIMPGHCVACGKCEELCVFDAIFFDGPGNGQFERTFRVDPLLCEGCGVCARYCPVDAIEFKPAVSGEWRVSDTRFGPMVHARLGVAESNSGKLVSTVREQARNVADEAGRDLVIVDGSPGIGCPVIASITGADLALAVTEPTLSGRHDLERVMSLARRFETPLLVCVNKWDINPEATAEIERLCAERGVASVGRVRYSDEAPRAIARARAVVEDGDGPMAQDIREVWAVVAARLERMDTGA